VNGIEECGQVRFELRSRNVGRTVERIQSDLRAEVERIVRRAYHAGMHAERNNDRTQKTEDAVVRELVG
jgi:hypothetical protein